MKALFGLFFFLSLSASLLQVPTGKHPDLRDHPGHYPLISFLTFQRYSADWVIGDHTDWFDPEWVQKGDVILVDYFYLNWFVDHLHDEIREPYILLTTDKGAWAPHPRVHKILYDPKCAAWFARNMVFSGHPKLFQLPMGPDVGFFRHEVGAEKELLEAIQKKPYPKKHMLYMNFYPRKHGDRDQIVQLFEHQPYCFSGNRTGQTWTSLPLPLFYEELASSQFALSPLGFETDCLRTWEALILGTIPIVEHSFLDPLFQGLPVVKVHQWSEIDLPFLEEQYAKLKNVKDDRKLYFDYWQDQILNVKAQVKKGHWPFASWEATCFSQRELEHFESILKEKGNRVQLVYKGFLSSSHPFQIALFSRSISTLYLYDAWLDPKGDPFSSQDPLETSRYLRAFSHLSQLGSEDDFDVQIPFADALFLDFSYYRYSLYFKHFDEHVIGYDHFRHSLQKDLEKVYDRLKKGAILFGNRADDEYVSECLERFSKERNASVTQRGTFWVIHK